LRRDRLSKEEQLAYDSHIEDLRVQRSVMQTGLFEGREEGREEGRKEGLKKGEEIGIGKGIEIGLKEGREEGLREGIEKGLKSVAERALKNGMLPEAVMELTGLTKEEISSLSL
jgi:predicted transposase YdaD